jgi:hypothetical protein
MRIARLIVLVALWLLPTAPSNAQAPSVDGSGKLQVALSKQPLSPNGPSKGPTNRMVAASVRGAASRR